MGVRRPTKRAPRPETRAKRGLAAYGGCGDLPRGGARSSYSLARGTGKITPDANRIHASAGLKSRA